MLYPLEVASLINSPFDNSDVSFRQKLDVLTNNIIVESMQYQSQNHGICHLRLVTDTFTACLKSYLRA